MPKLFICLQVCCFVLPGVVSAQSLKPVFSGGVTVIHQRVNDERIDSLTSASADLFVNVERESGSWLIYLEGNSSPAADAVASVLVESNADAGSALDADRRGRVQVSELNYTFQGDNSTLTSGLIDPSGYLDRSRITNDENVQFIGAGFVNNPTIEFPDYSLGFAYRRAASDALPEFNLVLSSSHGLADNPNLSYPQLLSINDGDKGVFAGAGIGVRSDTHLLRVGAWINTASHTDLDMQESGRNNYGVYGVYGLTNGNHGLNIRAGLANDEVSQAAGFLAVAYRLQLGNNALGLGVSRSYVSAHLADPALDDTVQYELFYRIALGANAHITPSLQYLVNSGFDGSNLHYKPQLTIAGLRLHYAF